MTKDQKIIGALAVITGIAGLIVLGTGGLSASPQAMCSSKDVEATLYKLWVDTLSGVSMASVLGIPALPNEAQVLAPTPKKAEVTFVSDPIAVQYDRDLQRVICQRQLTTNNGFINLSMRVAGKSAITTNYSVQPGTSGGYIVSILSAPPD